MEMNNLIMTEYISKQDLKFPEIISITPVVKNGRKMFKYKLPQLQKLVLEFIVLEYQWED